MSEVIRRLQIYDRPASDYAGLQALLPSDLQRGVGRAIEITPQGSQKVSGVSLESVQRQSRDLAARAAVAQERAKRIRLSDKQKKLSPEKREELLSAPYADLADQIRQASKEDGSPTVLAGLATALLTLDAPTRQMVLRRAGNPEVFDSISGAGVAEPPEGTDAMMPVVRQEKPTASDLPTIQRPASHLAGPDRIVTKGPNAGEVKSGAKDYENYEIRDNESLSRLAGPMLKQMHRIESAGGTPRLPLAVAEPKTKTDFKGDAIPRRARIDENTITVGTDPNYWKMGDRKGGKPTADMQVARRNRDRIDSTLRSLNDATETGGVFDLDKLFPHWRIRFATVDDAGNIVYPKALPSAEFVTGLMRGMLKSDDPAFFDRHLETIRRSIAAAPDAPDPNVTRIGNEKTAHDYSQLVRLPNKQMEKILRTQQVGSPDYPYPIYGDRAVDRPDVTAPERHPFRQSQAPAVAPSPEDSVRELRRLTGSAEGSETPGAISETPAPEDSLRELRRLMGKPEVTDQSSIYRMQSPLAALLA